jgi:NAD(P)-dependent dehydrogenase (short-subunit alcohol dehydrogenase family)
VSMGPGWMFGRIDVVVNNAGNLVFGAVEEFTMEGIDTSHSPFLSRPRELGELLVHATTTRPVAALTPA